MITWIYAAALYLFVGAILERVVSDMHYWESFKRGVFIVLWPLAFATFLGGKLGTKISNWIEYHYKG